ncbi:polysaccharide deacetylase family protein [Candidatus Omnitrophota bacterium]
MKQKIPFRKQLRKHLGNIAHKKKSSFPNSLGLRALVYHSVTDKLVENEWEENTTPKDLFARQMKYLADNEYRVISCDQGIEYLINNQHIPPRTVVITFDDGYRDNYINALPILKKYSFRATIFLTADFLRDHSGNMQYLSCSEINDIKNSGIIDFGCHGLTHKALSTLDKETLKKEIEGSKLKLEGIINNRIALFAYPFGHSGSYNQKVIDALRSAGFKGAFTSIFGLNHLTTNPFLLRRNRISWLDDLDEFEKHLLGAYDWCAICECLRPKRYRV